MSPSYDVPESEEKSNLGLSANEFVCRVLTTSYVGEHAQGAYACVAPALLFSMSGLSKFSGGTIMQPSINIPGYSDDSCGTIVPALVVNALRTNLITVGYKNN